MRKLLPVKNPPPEPYRPLSDLPDGVPGLSAKDLLFRKILDYGLLALLIWTPLPIASVESWSILIIEIAALTLFSVYLFMDQKPRPSSKLLEVLRRVRPALIGLFIFLGVQLVPWPVSIARVLSPRAAALRAQYVPGSAASGTATLSLLPGRTLASALELSAYVLIGFLILRTVTHRRQIRRMMLTLVAMGVFEAAYGLFEMSQSSPRLLFYRKSFGLESVTGTFVNRNHLAGYLEMIIPLALGLMISRIDLFGEPGKSWRDRFRRLLSRGSASNLLLGAGLVVMSVALLLSNSRSGVVILILSFVLIFVLTAVHFGNTLFRQAWVRRFIKIAVVAIILIGLYLGLETMIGRFAVDKLLQDGRPVYWGTVMSMIGQFPVFGVGLGAFGQVFQAYDSTGMEYALVHAHNDYLEFFCELGIVGFGLLAFVLGLILFKSFRTWSQRRHPELKGLALGGLASVTAILLHSLTDFNLRIPANALVFSVVLALTLKTVYHRKT